MNDQMQTQFMQTSQGLASVGYENLRNFSNTQDTIKDGNYSLSSQLANCCCTTQRGIDSVNYNGAINTAAIQQTVTEQTQKVLDTITGNRMADMQNRSTSSSCPRRCVALYATPTPSPITPARRRSVVTVAAVWQTSNEYSIYKAFPPVQDRGMAQAVPLFQ